MAERFYLVDGAAFAYRSFYAIPGTLSDSKGRPTNAVYGFTRILLKLLREEQPSHIAVVFDAATGRASRTDMYAGYKAMRRATPAELGVQFPLMDRVVEALAIPLLRIEGVEADDVIGTLAKRAEADGMEAIIVTGDKDLMQMVNERIRIYDPSKGDKGQWYADKEVKEKFGVGPDRVVDALALIGDATDNVPGVRGIGEKTAYKLLEQYHSLEGIYEHLDEMKGRVKTLLEEGRDSAFLSRQLVTLDTDVPLDIDFHGCVRHEPDLAALTDLFTELSFQTLLKEFLPDASTQEELDYRIVLTRRDLEDVIKELRESGSFALCTRSSTIDPMWGFLVGISFSCCAQKSYYVPLAHAAAALRRKVREDDLFGEEELEPLSKKEALALLKPLLEDPEVEKIGHDIKTDLIALRREGISLQGITIDTMVASYLTDPSRVRHNLPEVSLQYLKRNMILLTDVVGKGSKAITFDKVPVDRACDHACEHVDVTWRLAVTFRKLLRERALEPLYNEVELPLIRVLARMQMAGIAIDSGVFERLQVELNARLKGLESEIFEDAGEAFQINSPKQLQTILFEKLKLSARRKIKTGFSTDMEVLEELAQDHPLPRKILEYRTLDKLRGTYVEALPRLVNPETGRIHTSFNQAVTATGRLSSSDPNLQNIPVRNDLGRRIREGFIPGDKSWRLISADYSQIELRILAHLSGDENLRLAFERDADIHRETAARVFGVAPEDVNSDMRRMAKVVNFGIMYGISPFGLAKNLRISTGEAAKFI
jgi:DNA polymerase-1